MVRPRVTVGALLALAGICMMVASPYVARAAGERWQRVGAAGMNIRAIAIDPTNNSRVYAAARNDGIYRSTDRGLTWTQSNKGLDFIAAWGVSVDPRDPSIVWAATEVGGAYRSTDSGKTWRHTHDGMTDGLGDYGVSVPTEVSSVDTGSWADENPEKANRGGMWGYPVDQCVSGQAQAGPGTRCAERADWPVGGYDLRDPDIDADAPGDQPAAAPYPRTIFHFLFSSDIAAVPGGAWITSFRGSNNRLGGGAFLTTDGGATWEMRMRSASGEPLISAHRSLEEGNIWRVRVALSNPSRVYLASSQGVWRSDDGGKTWLDDEPVGFGERPINPVEGSFFTSPLDVRALAVDPANADRVYAGGWGGGIWRSTDAGRSWTQTSSGLPPGAGVWDIAVNPANPKNLFAAVFYAGVFQSIDGGDNWSLLVDGLPDDPKKQVYAVATDQGSPQALYAGTIDGVYRLASDSLGKPPPLATTGSGPAVAALGALLLAMGVLIGRMGLRAGDENRTRA